MSSPCHRRGKCFTLVEIMVAMAILVVLMGFLFEFVIGAQEIWSASRKVSGSYGDARNAMRWLEDDLRASVCQDETRYPGRPYPFVVEKDGKRLKSISMVLARKNRMDANDKRCVFPVKYEFEHDHHKLYRYELPRTADYGAAAFESPQLSEKEKKKHLMLDGIYEFKFLTAPGNVLDAKPRLARMEMALCDPEVILQADETADAQAKKELLDRNSRVFSKIIFLDR